MYNYYGTGEKGIMQISAKEIAALLRTLSRTANKPHFTSAIIAAAGCGSRMKTSDGKTKQLMELCGMPVIVHTLKAFEECEKINEIIIVTRSDEADIYEKYKSEYGLTKISAVVIGGDTRQESVLRGFEAISDKSDFVTIHDGARCLVTPEIIEKTVRAAYKQRAAAAGHKSEDTVKLCDPDGMIEGTQDREKVWLVQTPQIFMCDVYRVSAYMAKQDEVAVTDDCMMCERLGFDIKIVECGRENIKLTSPGDLGLCEAILTYRKAMKEASK